MKAANFDTAENVKLRKDALTDYIHGKSDFSSAENGAKPLIEYVHENYCSNRDVATGNYDCPYATTVLNTICCTGHECNHKGIYEKPVVNNTAPFEPIVINEEDLPF